MGKRDYKHFTAVFGNDAEAYMSRLLLLMRHPQGDRRPDLVSFNGHYNPKLSVEVKSGIDGKVSLVSYQLQYGVTAGQDYRVLFGEDIGDRLPGLSLNTPSSKSPVNYYYCVISRPKKVTSQDVVKPYSAIQLEWGDQIFVPHDLVFSSFALGRSMRTGERYEEVVDALNTQIEEDIREGSSHHSKRRKIQDWQSLYLRDLKAIFEDDPNIATEGGKERIKLLAQKYEGYSDLAKVEISGPNGTRMMVLAKPEDYELFDRNVRNVVRQRKPIIETVTRARRRAAGLLGKITSVSPIRLFNQDPSTVSYTTDNLSPEELRRLQRLCAWAHRDEPLGFGSFYDPKIDGCSDEIEVERSNAEVVSPIEIGSWSVPKVEQKIEEPAPF